MTRHTEISQPTVLAEPRAVVADSLPAGGIHFRTPGWESQVFIRGEARVGKVFRPSGTELFPCPPDVRLVASRTSA